MRERVRLRAMSGAAGALLLLASACGNGGARGDGAALATRATGDSASSPEAQQAIDAIRAAVKDLQHDPALAGFDHGRGGLEPVFPAPAAPKGAWRSTARRARVSLPLRSDGELRLEDEASGVAIGVVAEDVTDAPAETADGFVVYRAAHGTGTDVAYRATPEGTEDFVRFETKPEREELRYRVDVTHVAGLRLVANTLEFLDDGGAPRLRVAPPYVVDAAGDRHEARLRVEGCAFDADGSAPWGRPVTAPGAWSCTVRVDWGDVAYPALLDPAWTTTGSMAVARAFHTETLLGSGKVLIVGGHVASSCLSGAELYDGTSSFAATGSMATARSNHSATLLASGKVLVAGGGGTCSGAVGGPLSTAELFDGASFAPTGSMATARDSHTATLLASGKVLVAGGASGGSSAELFDGTATFTATGSMGIGRYYHTATRLSSGKVLIAGGGAAGAMTSAELFDGASTFAATGSLAPGRSEHTATLLASGKVLVAGGEPSRTSATLFDGTSNFTATGSLVTMRVLHTATLLGSGHVLIAGFGAAEQFDGMSTFTTAGSMVATRFAHTATLLDSGAVLVTGGYWESGGVVYLSSAELYQSLANGGPCSVGAGCNSGFCADGVCCDAACTSKCMACTAAKKGSGVDGVCALIPDGSDPENECPSQGSGVCTGEGVCNGAGNCRSTLRGTTCNPASCASSSVQTNASTCDANGACLTNGNTDCAPYTCQGTGCTTTCTTTSNCASGSACVGNQCVTAKALGAACTANVECASVHCVDNLCCDKACSGACEACANAKKSSGPDGICGPSLPNLVDPLCPNTGGCGPDGTCDGVGACRANASATKPCGASNVCASTSSSAGQLCDGNGSCVTSAGTSCAPYGCSSTTGLCLQTCSLSSECAATFFCKGSVCVPVLIDGETCTKDEQCEKGHCVDGYCCESACSGTCMSCNGQHTLGAQNGKCDFVKDSSDPAGECAMGGTACGADGFCDGAGDCRQFAAPTKPCLPDDCVTNTVAEHRCDGFGSCAAHTKTDCGAYSCDALAAACKTSCSVDADCASGNFCSSNVCQPLATQGAPCSAASQCTTGFCADGFCCNAACTGQCESCSAANQAGTPGTCSPVPDGATPRSSCPSSAVPCGADGLCGANGSCRTTAPQGTACGTTCVGADSHAAKACDASGACVAGAPLTCAPYACDATSGLCKTTCAVKGDCSANAECDPANGCAPGTATCKSDGVTLVSPGANEHSCAPYACQGGACVVKCTTTSDCAPGHDCAGESCVSKPTSDGGTAGSGGTGGAAPADVSQEKGCGCRVPGATSGEHANAIALSVLGFALQRRRRTRRRRATRMRRQERST